MSELKGREKERAFINYPCGTYFLLTTLLNAESDQKNKETRRRVATCPLVCFSHLMTLAIMKGDTSEPNPHKYTDAKTWTERQLCISVIVLPFSS